MTTKQQSLEQTSEPPVDENDPKYDTKESQKTFAKQLFLGVIFGMMFGFLLQKGGVAKYHILMGALLLEDFTVAKVMLSAIIVGSIGIFTLHSLSLVNLHIKPTRYGANILGGLLFGVGFALMGYCPGTGAAALGQGNWDALAAIVGLMVGSYLFAEASGGLEKTLMLWGERGKVMLPGLVKLSLTTFLMAWIPILLLVLFAIDRFSVR